MPEDYPKLPVLNFLRQKLEAPKNFCSYLKLCVYRDYNQSFCKKKKCLVCFSILLKSKHLFFIFLCVTINMLNIVIIVCFVDGNLHNVSFGTYFSVNELYKAYYYDSLLRRGHLIDFEFLESRTIPSSFKMFFDLMIFTRSLCGARL